MKILLLGILLLSSFNIYAFTCSTIEISSEKVLDTQTQEDGIQPIFSYIGPNEEKVMILVGTDFGYRPHVSVFVNEKIIATASSKRKVFSDENYNVNLKLYQLDLEIDCK